MQNIFDFIKKDNIGEPPWNYYFLLNLEKSEYPKYLAKIFKYKTGEKLPLTFNLKNKSWIIDKKRCKTFNQKIQWLKLYDVTTLKRDCTDKVKVRDFVKEKIGEEYLKPVLQICNNFDEINFDTLPNSFVIKCNHGCKWHYIIKNKNELLSNNRLFDLVKRNLTGWLEQDYSIWGGFEMQYKGVKPKLLIETLLREDIDAESTRINVYCFKNIPKIIVKLYEENKMNIWNEHLESIDIIFNAPYILKSQIDEKIKQSYDLSKYLSDSFNFVRVDWMIFSKKLFFEELTFTPFSGFQKFDTKINNLKLGSLIDI